MPMLHFAKCNIAVIDKLWHKVASEFEFRLPTLSGSSSPASERRKSTLSGRRRKSAVDTTSERKFLRCSILSIYPETLGPKIGAPYTEMRYAAAGLSFRVRVESKRRCEDNSVIWTHPIAHIISMKHLLQIFFCISLSGEMHESEANWLDWHTVSGLFSSTLMWAFRARD